MVDQDHRHHIVQTFKPSPSSSSFQRPKTDMNIASGYSKFAELKVLDNDSYVKDDVMYIKCIVDTTNELTNKPVGRVIPFEPNRLEDDDNSEDDEELPDIN